MAVAHSLAANAATENLIVEIWDQGGRRGWGEGVPRAYVTGESVQASLDFLRQRLLPLALGQDLDPGQALECLARLCPTQDMDRHPAAACALETALLDLAGRGLGRPVSWLLGGQRRSRLTYSGVLPLLPPEVLPRMLAMVQSLGLTELKVKVGRPDDLERLALVRRVLGDGLRLRVDANGAWGVEEAVASIKAMEALGVEVVEQPVAGRDLAGLAEVSRRVGPLIMADESLCTAQQARTLIASGARVAFNLRLSKCGGFGRTLALRELAQEAGLPCQLGCQVGELGLLSAAGRHLAAACPELIHLEGSLTRFYLARDLIEQDLTFGPGGVAPALEGPGLGVEVWPPALAPCRIFSLS